MEHYIDKNLTTTTMIELTGEETAAVAEMLIQNLQYWIYESNCKDEYAMEINASLLLLEKMGFKSTAMYLREDKAAI